MIKEENLKWWALVAMTSSVSLIFLNQTALTVILPVIQGELHGSALGTQWIVNTFLLFLTISLLAGGRLGDILGHRKTFFLGMFIFALASVSCAVSQTEQWLLTSRAVQGIGGAIFCPATAAILFSAFPLHERGKAMGIFVCASTICMTLGPFVGGLLTECLSWRFIFWLNIPIAAFGMAIARFSVASSKMKKDSFDFLSFIAFGIGISCLLMALMQGSKWGWSSPTILSLIIAGCTFLLLLGFSKRLTTHPLIDFSLYKDKVFIGANFAIFITQFLVMTSMYWTLYFQHVLEFSPTLAGAIVLLSGCPVIFMAPLAGRLTDRYGPRYPITVGFALMVFSLVWILFASIFEYGSLLLPGIFIFGCGGPLIFTPAAVACLNQVPAERRGVVSAMLMTLRQLGGTFGVAVIGTLFLNTHSNYFDALLQANAETQHLEAWMFEGFLAESEEALEIMSHLSSELSEYVLDSFMSAYHSAFFIINSAALCLGLAGFVAARILLKTEKAPTP